MDEHSEMSSILGDNPELPPDSPAAPPPDDGVVQRRSVVRRSEAHGQQLLSALRSFRETGLLFDFTINAQDQSFPCHCCVLAAASHFFRAMFEVNMRERDDRSVTLGNQSPVAVCSFLDFAYSGEATITDDNVDMLFQLASFLQVPVLSRACSDFLIETLDLSNCLTLLALAEGYGSASLLRRANEFVVENFQDLSLMPEFLDMQVHVLEACLQADALSVCSEEAAVMSLLRWTGHDLQERRRLLPRLLPLLRLTHLPTHALKALGETEQLFSGDEVCCRLLREAEGRQRRYDGLLTDARPATTQTYIYIHKTEEDGDIQHAFCYCLETHQWRELPQRQGAGFRIIPDLPGSRLTSYAEKLFVTGGCRGNCCRAVRMHVAEPSHDATDEVWCLCPVTQTCTPAPAMGKPRTMHTAVTALHRLYVLGGRTTGSRGAAPGLLEVEYFDPLTQAWTSVSPLPRAMFYPEASACRSLIYTLGAQLEITDSFNPLLDCFFCYDVIADQWSNLVVESGHLFHATLVKAVAVSDTLHLCDLSTYKVYSFCPETCVWAGVGSFECAGFNAGTVGVADRIYILGGDYSPGEVTDEVQVYHSERSQWEEVAPMPRALTEFHCQLISFNRYRDPWRPRETT